MRLKKLLTLAIVVIICFPIMVFAEPKSSIPGTAVGSTDLIQGASSWDGKYIEYSGEVIGDIMMRENHAWVHILDKDNTVSCYVPAKDAKKIDKLGKYGVVGDSAKVTGIFNRACKEHGGDLDIHVETFKITSAGYEKEMAISMPMFMVALGALAVSIILIVLVFRKVK